MNSKPSFSEYIRQSQVICFALIIGQLFFLGISIYLVKFSGENFGDTGLNGILIYVVPLFAILSILGSLVVFKSKLNKLKENSDLDSKLVEYRSAQIIRWALLEGPSFFSIIAYILTGNYLFIVIVTIIIVLFVLTIPNREKVENELNLSWEEKNKLIY